MSIYLLSVLMLSMCASHTYLQQLHLHTHSLKDIFLGRVFYSHQVVFVCNLLILHTGQFMSADWIFTGYNSNFL